MQLTEKAYKNMQLALQICKDYDELVDVYAACMKHLKRVPGHFPRHLEYPWILGRISRMAGVTRAVDVGSGISPLPIILAERGVEVATFDSSSEIRSWEDRKKWNGWGYLDYGKKYRNVRSHNRIFTADQLPAQVDVLYTVSVLEHTPKRLRLDVWREAYAALRPGGRTIHTIDVVPNSQRIWNLSMGQRVEPAEVHGTVEDIRKELTEAGFRILEFDRKKDVPMSPVDLLCVVAEK
jgi:2-polyprenyl-3-methyl-5-hydroxy-6-metoxy-1,4-benzoquinol methylase